MSELKTLGDLIEWSELNQALYDTIKAEAVKWRKGKIESIKHFIDTFFNITEEDLKEVQNE